MGPSVTADLWRVAVRASLGGGTWPDEAIEAAVKLLAAGDERPEVMEVAILPPGVTSADACDAVEALLRVEGIPVVRPHGVDSARLRLVAGAFVREGISVEDFGRFWWGDQLPAHDQQSNEQTRVTVALDAWESEADLAARVPVADALRHEVAGWLTASAAD